MGKILEFRPRGERVEIGSEGNVSAELRAAKARERFIQNSLSLSPVQKGGKLLELGKTTYVEALDLGSDELRRYAVDLLRSVRGTEGAARVIQNIQIKRKLAARSKLIIVK